MVASALGEPCATVADCSVPAPCVVATCKAGAGNAVSTCGLAWPDLSTPTATKNTCEWSEYKECHSFALDCRQEAPEPCVEIPLTQHERCGRFQTAPDTSARLAFCEAAGNSSACVEYYGPEFGAQFETDCSVFTPLQCEDPVTTGRRCRLVGGECQPAPCAGSVESECKKDKRCGWVAAKQDEPAHCAGLACCDDGLAETIGDRIIGVSGSTAQCLGIQWDDGNPCTRDSFDNGVPQAVAILDSFVGMPGCPSLANCFLALPCDDGNPCTLLDRCGGPDGTQCAGDPVVTTSPEVFTQHGCQVLMCDEEGRAWYQARPLASCHNGDPCTLPGTCSPNGTCSAGDPVDCTDDDPCTAGEYCDPASGCVLPPAVDGTPCSDENPCTANDQCIAGLCEGGAVLPCDDEDPSTSDHCDFSTGDCVHRPIVPSAPSLPDVRVDFDGLIVPEEVGTVKERISGTSDYSTVQTIEWCPIEVFTAKASDAAPACGLGPAGDPDCGPLAAPTCLLFDPDDCPAGFCSSTQVHVVNRFAGRTPLAAATLERSLLAVNARQVFGSPQGQSDLVGTVGLWFALDSVYGTDGLGRVTLLDTNATGDGPEITPKEWRIRLEIGHSLQTCVGDRQDESGSGGGACQAGRNMRHVNAWFAYGGDPDGPPTTTRLLQLPIHDWTNRSWHHVALVLRETELCLVLDGTTWACAARPPDFLPHSELPDYLYVLGRARPELSGLEDRAGRQVRLDRLESFRTALTAADVATWFASGVEAGPILQAGNLELTLTGKHDGYGIRSIRDRRTGQILTTRAPTRALWSVRLIPRHDLHTGLYDPSPEVKALGKPAVYSPAFDNLNSSESGFQVGRRSSDIASPWSFFIDNLSVAVPSQPEITSTTGSDGSTHLWIQYHDVPLPSPSVFDRESSAASDINLPPLLQDPMSGASSDASSCEGPGCPQAGRLETVLVHLWTVPGDPLLRGQILVDLESDYWSLAETEFPILDGVARQGAGVGAFPRLVLPDNNLGRDVEVPTAQIRCQNCGACSVAPYSCPEGNGSVDANGACVSCDAPTENVALFGNGPQPRIYPSRHMSMPFVGVYDGASEIGGLFLAVAGNRGRLSHFPIRRGVSIATDATTGAHDRVAPPEPWLRFSIVDVAEGAGEPGNDTSIDAWDGHTVALALQDGNWFDFASRYRSIAMTAPWMAERLALRTDVPSWLTQAGYYTTATRRDDPVNETRALAELGLPADLQLTELRAWTRSDAVGAYFDDQTNGNDTPFLGDTPDYTTPDYDWVRLYNGLNRRRFPALGFSSMLTTDGTDPQGIWQRGGPVSLYTNPALIDLGREWATAPGLMSVFYRGPDWWPVREAMLPKDETGLVKVRVEFGDPASPLAFFSGVTAGKASITHASGKSVSWPVGVGAGPANAGLDHQAPISLHELPLGEPPINPQSDSLEPTTDPTPRPDYRCDTCKINSDTHYGCPGHPSFRSVIVNQLTKFGRLPVDPFHNHPVQGLYIDQVGTVSPRRCDSSAHGGPGGHRPGGGTYWTDGWRSILGEIRSSLRATHPDAGIYGEGFNEVLVGIQDGFLVLHDAGADVVPLAQVVYHDRAQFIGRYTQPASETVAVRDVVAFQSFTFANGSMAGGVYGPYVTPASPARGYLRHLAYWRRLYPDAAVYGRMERPPALSQLGVATSSTSCALDTTGTAAGVSVTSLPSGTSTQPLDVESRFVKNKDTQDRTIILPMAIAGAFTTRPGNYVITIASSDDNQARQVILTFRPDHEPTSAADVTVRVRNIGVPFAYGPSLGPAVQVPVVEGQVVLNVSLPACAAAQLEVTMGTAAP
ncbi:MAG: hypothetical protein IV100_11665 [Myxococcales bacterium]|nr:hypothetical protein [Myxococcales bacterium]